MAHQLNHPQTEQELNIILDNLYNITKNEIDPKDGTGERGKVTGFKGLLEIIGSEPNIVSAIHKIKANSGSKTSGVDNRTIRDFLDADYNDVLNYVKTSLNNYRPQMVRRVWIPKPGKTEKRPLGIPTIGDRIIQECVRNVIEPILEAQFFKHSYGFRPMRDAHNAIQRATDTMYKSGCVWVIEGDISKFFDTVNHNILLKKLHGMGIHDKRVLMIVKEMLKAGVMGESNKNEIGTPQGGIISPLLANVYLHSFDMWVTREWENKKTKTNFAKGNSKGNSMRLCTNLKKTFLVRYADDWVLITDSKENAEKWKHRIEKYLKDNLKLSLSQEKTLITNVSKRAVKFLGYEIKVRKGKSASGWITQTKPNQERLKAKIAEIQKDIKLLRRQKMKTFLILKFNLINSKVRGLAEYYSIATLVNPVMKNLSYRLWYTERRSMTKIGAVLKRAKEVDNLFSVHEKYNKKIWAIEYEGKWFGLTQLIFSTFDKGKAMLSLHTAQKAGKSIKNAQGKYHSK